MMIRGALATCVAAAIVAGVAFGADWPQFRGPARDGVAPASAPLVDEIAKDSLKQLWQSDDIRGGGEGGYGSAVVSGGRVFVYQNCNLPPVHRCLSKQAYDALGYAADIPADLSKEVETARASDERKKLDWRAIDPWVKAWLDAHVTPEQKQWRGAAQARLKAGANAVPLELCAKLAPLVGKRFETVAELDAWSKENGFNEDEMKRLRTVALPGEEKTPKDAVYCLDAATGKTIWTHELTANWYYYPCSSTPTVDAGRVFAFSSDARVFCLDFGTGNVIWKSDPLGPMNNHHNRSCCPLVVDGVVIVCCETSLAGFEAATGKMLWQKRDVKSEQGSPVPWSSGGKTYALVNAGKLWLIDPKDGTTLWSVPAGAGSMPAVAGDVAVVTTGDKTGLMAYKITPEKAEPLWKVADRDQFTSPIVTKDAVYALGGAYDNAGHGRAVCIDPATGTVKWEQVVGNAQHSTPLIADGKILAYNGRSLVMFRATTDKYTPLGTVDLGAEQWSSPALADGKLFVRTAKGIVCYSLSK